MPFTIPLPTLPPTRVQRMRRTRALRLTLAVLLPTLFLLVFRLLRGSKPLMNWLITYVTTPIKRFVSFLCDPLPFSMAEVCWTAAILALILFLGRSVWLIARREGKLARLGRRCVALASAGLTLYSCYTLMWGINYYGDSFSARSGLAARGATPQELYSLTLAFVHAANKYSGQVLRDEDGLFAEEQDDLFTRSQGIYDGIVEEFPFLDAPERTPKSMVYARLMSWMGFTGFFFPFTGEANLNTDPPDCLLPATILHEMAHQRNIAAEQECNFIAILGGLRSDDPAYRYSSALMGYIHLSNALYLADYDLWYQAAVTLNEAVRADIDSNNEYWRQFDSPAEDAAKAVYDGFLQSHDQELGMKSYGACVDLLVAYYFDWEREI